MLNEEEYRLPNKRVQAGEGPLGYYIRDQSSRGYLRISLQATNPRHHTTLSLDLFTALVTVVCHSATCNVSHSAFHIYPPRNDPSSPSFLSPFIGLSTLAFSLSLCCHLHCQGIGHHPFSRRSPSSGLCQCASSVLLALLLSVVPRRPLSRRLPAIFFVCFSLLLLVWSGGQFGKYRSFPTDNID